jgi:hypothetical protein
VRETTASLNLVSACQVLDGPGPWMQKKSRHRQSVLLNEAKESLGMWFGHFRFPARYMTCMDSMAPPPTTLAAASDISSGRVDGKSRRMSCRA